MQSTDAPQLTTDAPQAAPSAVSPFGPVRKREKPPVKIPGQRKPTDHVGPRPAAPTQRLTARPLGHDLTFDRGAYDASYDRFQHAADRAFGEGPDGSAT